MANNLDDVTWNAHIRVVDKDGTQHKDTRGVITLKLTSDTEGVKKPEDVQFQMSHEQALGLFKELEKIQERLDATR